MTGIETRLRQTMQTVADATAIPPVPRDVAISARKPRVGKRIVALIAVGGLGVIGVGAAAADGVLSPGADRAFSEWKDINPREAILLAEVPGPYGTRIAAFEAPDHTNGETCIAYELEGDPAFRTSQGSIGGQCSKLSEGDDGLGRSGGFNDQIEFPGRPTFAVFAFSAGPDAVSADLSYDGARHPVAVGNGYLVGWAPDFAWATSTLTAYDATGAVVGVIRNVGSTDGHSVAVSTETHD
ncbi:MAG TPA: hypothetical protein VHE57_13915 [Mycobacteriales bacterium]|nr:hypothetical protein [Mycobacteriales bacterium]